jgi:hypothetical protein
MKKSEIYHLAQIAVINSPSIAPEHKIEVMRILLDDESLALFVEDQEAKKAADEE